MQLWLHSDWHLWHHNIYEFTYVDKDGLERRVRERFTTCEEGDKYIASRWRDMVKPEDHVWCLGDITMERGKHRSQEFIAFMRSLPGHKRLILGNHDHLDAAIYTEAGFQKIRGSNLIDGVLCTHYPVHRDSITFRATGNAHGHIHQNDSPPGPYYNCSVERTDYEPIPIEVVQKKLRKLKDTETR